MLSVTRRKNSPFFLISPFYFSSELAEPSLQSVCRWAMLPGNALVIVLLRDKQLYISSENNFQQENRVFSKCWAVIGQRSWRSITSLRYVSVVRTQDVCRDAWHKNCKIFRHVTSALVFSRRTDRWSHRMLHWCTYMYREHHSSLCHRNTRT